MNCEAEYRNHCGYCHYSWRPMDRVARVCPNCCKRHWDLLRRRCTDLTTFEFYCVASCRDVHCLRYCEYLDVPTRHVRLDPCDLSMVVNRATSNLSVRNRLILLHRFPASSLQKFTQTQCAQMLGCTQPWVSRQENEAVRRLARSGYLGRFVRLIGNSLIESLPGDGNKELLLRVAERL